MRIFLSILISLLFVAQVVAQQTDTLTAEAADHFQGGGDVGTVKSGSLGVKYTTEEELTGENASRRHPTFYLLWKM